MAKKQRGGPKPEPGGRKGFEIVLAPDAVGDLRRLRASERKAVQEAMKEHLSHQPTRTSKARIKRLRGLSKPQYRLRVGDDLRVFYDVTEDRVEVLAILFKPDVEEWLKQEGVPE
jgi:mRNA interferase RelE/StbE